MTPEEYERLKEAEKEHLRKIRKLKSAVRDLDRQKKLTRAVENITDRPRALLDENEALVEQLAIDAARAEAKLDIAIESSDDAVETAAQQVADDDEMRKMRARELIRQIRQESGAAPEPAESTGKRAQSEETADSNSPKESESPKESAKKEQTTPLPEKTIGRMKP